MNLYSMGFDESNTIDVEEQLQKDREIFDNIIDTFDSDQYSSYNIEDIQDMDKRFECANLVLKLITNEYAFNSTIDAFNSVENTETKNRYIIKIASSLYRVFKVDNLSLLSKIIFKKLFYNSSALAELSKTPEEKRNHELMVIASITSDFHESKKLVKVIRHFINDEKFRKDHVFVKGVTEWAADELELIIKNQEISGKYSLDYEIFQKLLKIQNPNFLRTAYSAIIYNRSSHLMGTMVSTAIDMFHEFAVQNGKLDAEEKKRHNDGHLYSTGLFKSKNNEK